MLSYLDGEEGGGGNKFRTSNFHILKLPSLPIIKDQSFVFPSLLHSVFTHTAPFAFFNSAEIRLDKKINETAKQTHERVKKTHDKAEKSNAPFYLNPGFIAAVAGFLLLLVLFVTGCYKLSRRKRLRIEVHTVSCRDDTF